jgi:hypothetical protein
MAVLGMTSALVASTPAAAGDGTFATEPANPAFATGFYPANIVVGEFDNDGDVDLATVDTNSNKVTVRLGAGDGTFATAAPGSPFSVASVGVIPGCAFGPLPRAIAVGDFDEDGDEDLAITNGCTNELAIHLGNGDGSFSAGTFMASCDGPTSIAAGDFDLDGNDDLVAACADSTGVAGLNIHTGNGDGTFDAGAPLTTGSQPGAVAIADFNGDGDEDLVVGHISNDGVKVYPGAAGATFGAATNVIATGLPNGVVGTPIVAGDFNSDNNDDLAFHSSGLHVATGAGDGTFTSSFAFNAGSANSLAAGDFNSDGVEDLAIPAWAGNSVTIRLGAGNGTFPGEPTGSPFAAGTTPQAVAIGDFNGDGNEDFAATNVNANSVTVRLGGGTPLLSGNLLTNGGAEGAGLARTLAGMPAVPGWTTDTGTFTHARYSVPGLPQYLDAARWEGGLGMFTGGPGAADSTASQSVDVSGSAAAIDAGTEGIRLSALLGGKGASNDRMSVAASFRNAGAVEIGMASIGPVGAADRKNRTELIPREVNAAVPVGTRSIVVTLTATHAEGAYNDALADNVILRFAAPPGPPPNRTLTVTTSGGGSGTVTGAGIDCGGGPTHTDCSETVANGTQVTLTATPGSGSQFAGYTGGGCGTPSPCTVTLNADASVDAAFNTMPVATPDPGPEPDPDPGPGDGGGESPLAPDPKTICKNAVPTITGTGRNDKLIGTEGEDVIFAGNGNDKVKGLGGRDIICTGPGEDEAHGGEGNDAINTARGDDKAFGDAGNDRIYLHFGTDIGNGGDGDDELIGAVGADRCIGAAGTDTAKLCERKQGIP